MVEVFKTNVSHPLQAKYMAVAIERSFDGCKVNFDLDDCDKILRVEGERVDAELIIRLARSLGLRVAVLPDVVAMFEFELM